MPVMVDWDKAVKTFGDLMEPQDIYPPRWRVRAYPSKEQLAHRTKDLAGHYRNHLAWRAGAFEQLSIVKQEAFGK